MLTAVSHGKPPLAQAEAEAEADPTNNPSPSSAVASGQRDLLNLVPKERRMPILTDVQIRLGKLFNRRLTTPWNDKERKALKAIGDVVDEDDLRALERYYTAKIPNDQDYRRHDLQTLLNNFNGEVDRARKFKPASIF